MDRLFKTFVYAFLWSLSLVCAAKNDTVTVIQTLPKVECANKILDNEIIFTLIPCSNTITWQR